MHGGSRWQIPECQALASRDYCISTSTCLRLYVCSENPHQHFSNGARTRGTSSMRTVSPWSVCIPSTGAIRLICHPGKWKAQPPISFMSLGTRMRQFSGESREEFLDFMGCMVRWLPEERWTARQLLQHSWLNGINWDLM